MRVLICIVFICLIVAQCASAQEAYLGWFTDASIINSTKMSTPTGAPALVSGGTVGDCLDLTQSIGVTNTLLSQTRGIVSFWLRPKWDGNDGLSHKFVGCGTSTEGFVIDKTPAGNIRFLMAGGGKTTAVRSNVNGWHAGEWHHIMVAWIDKNNTPIGLAMWIDRVPVASCVYGGTRFFTVPYPKTVYIGDSSSQAYMDELVFRNSFNISDAIGCTPIAYRDYFRTAPYTSIEITNKAQHVNSDTRAVAGYKKQFGVTGTRTFNANTGSTISEYITDSDGPQGSTWDTFDAKPYITWTSGDTSKATVDSSGLVTGVATTTSPITLTANLHGLVATYPLTVVSANQPDLDLMYVERTPRYHALATKVWPAVGETVTSIAHIGNFGSQAVASFSIKFELIPDTNGNFVLDATETATTTVTRNVTTALQPGAKRTETFTWTWPSTQTFVRVTVDPTDAVAEVCEANNQRCELNKARAVRWGYGYDPEHNGNTDYVFVNDYNKRVMNLVGSFSDYDWCNANTDRIALMLRETVCSTSSPMGIQDSVRADDFTTTDAYLTDHSDPNGPLHDGGYEEMWDTRMTLSPGNIHEMGHNLLKLCDMYGHGLSITDILFNDENGAPYGGTPLVPDVGPYEGAAPWSSATWGYPDALGIGYNALMVNNHPWLSKDLAAWIQYSRQTRKGQESFDFGASVPSNNSLKLLDVNDNPLVNARIYIYQTTNTGYFHACNKFYPGRPKFIGITDASGVYVIPKMTCQYWDDWATDAVEGSVSAPTPFDRSNGQRGWPPSWMVGEMLLLRIVGANGNTEFQTLPLTELNIAYFSGNTFNATYAINTSLTSPSSAPDVVAPTVAAGGQQPIANIRYDGVTHSDDFSITIPYSATQSYVLPLDASVSTDPENQPLFYKWDSQFGTATSALWQLTIPAGQAVGSYPVNLYVIDGVRYSRMRGITVNITNMTMSKITGRVTDQNGAGVSSAKVGIKKSTRATADALYYLTTDGSGNYTSPYVPSGTYYVAAWKSGWTPTLDKTAVVSGADKIVDLQLTETQGTKISLASQNMSASDSASSYSTQKAIDGSYATEWATNTSPAEPVYFYIDLGGLTDITWLSLYRYLGSNSHQATYDNYSIDVMASGNSLDPTSWQGNPSVRTVYSADNTLHGYLYSTGVAHDPIRLDATGVKGMRITMKNINWPKYEIRELAIYTNNPPGKIVDAKKLPVDTSCKISYKEITAVPGAGIPANVYYVQEQDRSSAIRLDLTSVPLTGAKVGDMLSVSGNIKETAAGERYVLATSRTNVLGTAAIKPIGMNNRAVWTSGSLARGILTKIWGKVSVVGANDFTVTAGGDSAVKVLCGNAAKPAQDAFVAVTGIVSTDSRPLLLMKLGGWTEVAP